MQTLWCHSVNQNIGQSFSNMLQLRTTYRFQFFLAFVAVLQHLFSSSGHENSTHPFTLTTGFGCRSSRFFKICSVFVLLFYHNNVTSRTSTDILCILPCFMYLQIQLLLGTMLHVFVNTTAIRYHASCICRYNCYQVPCFMYL